MYQDLAIKPWQVAAALGQKQRGKRYCINEALIDCFAAAGFAVRDGMTQDERELFVFEALVESVIVPSLREHKEDIPELVRALLAEMNTKHDRASNICGFWSWLQKKAKPKSTKVYKRFWRKQTAAA